MTFKYYLIVASFLIIIQFNLHLLVPILLVIFHPLLNPNSLTSWRVRKATPEDWKSFSSLVDTYLKNVQPADLPQISSSHHTTSNIIEYVWNRIKTAFTTAASIAIGKHDNNRSYEFWWQHPEVTKAKQQLSKARRKFNKSPNSQNKLLLKSANKHFKTTATAVKSKLWNSFSQQLQNGKIH